MIFTEIIKNTMIYFVAVGVMFLIDFATGFGSAWANKEISSTKMRKSVPKFISYFGALIMALILDIVFEINIDIGDTSTIYPITALMGMFLISIECFSFSENFKKITGISLPQKIIDIFKSKIKNIKKE